MDIVELEEMTSTYLPNGFLKAALRSVFTGHEVSHEYVRGEFAAEEADNLLPYYRRAKIEGYLRDAAQRSGLDARVLKSPGSGWWHTEVRSGPVILTASAVQAPCGLVDPSEFRLSLAEPNPEYLWEEPGDVPAGDLPLYALLLHSRSQWVKASDRRRYGMLPGSAYLAFPSSGLESYLHSINLFERFPDVVESFMPQEWDSEARVRYVANARRIATA